MHLFPFDALVSNAMPMFWAPYQNSIMLFISAFFDIPFSIIFFVLFFLFLVLAKHPRYARYFFFASVGTALSDLILKYTLLVPRIPVSLVVETTPSFPSGHASLAMVFFFSLALFFSKEQTGFRKFVSYLLGFVCIFTIGLSRIYLNAHTVTDVLAGFLLGAFWIILSLRLFIQHKK